MENQKKTVIVTGSSTGIGRATAERFARDGYNVVVNGRSEDALKDVVATIGKDNCAVACADVAKKDEAYSIVDTAIKAFGRIDVVVNNAGVAIPGNADTLADTDFEKMLAINVSGMRHVTLAALPHLRKSGGNVVNVTSVSGLGGDWGMYGYNTSKGAVTLLTKGLALDLGREGIRVNAVAPTATRTRAMGPLEGAQKTREALFARIPMGRLGEPVEVANAILFLASSEASFINGTILTVDGGLSASNGQSDLFMEM